MSYRLTGKELRIIEQTKESEAGAKNTTGRHPLMQMIKPYIIFAGLLLVIVLVFSAVIMLMR